MIKPQNKKVLSNYSNKVGCPSDEVRSAEQGSDFSDYQRVIPVAAGQIMVASKVNSSKLDGKQEMERLSAQSKIFISEQDFLFEQAMESLANASIRTVGPDWQALRSYRL
ncbi:hypothetical protein RT717_00110 [Imperialibacter roseus]|uniref:Uncharacterized protein n=1 Tax=Imperialibacter roseus TaxID=1324217 RepID=A0ABZ0IPW0_9BACT|nr:hypothetical protein [Imperialibacter roseus]WOK07024.1 hypothetical protein RT717_00110 [Imperialibacter roseus]